MSDTTERWYDCYGGTRHNLFTRQSNDHPAKMAVGLCFRIFDHGEKRNYWHPGDLILDPLAGIFTSGIVGASLGYRVLGVELEQKFVDWAWENIERCAQRVPGAAKSFVPTGGIPPFGIMQGDARFLQELLCDGVLTSPPYGDSQITGSGHFRSRHEPNAADAASNPREGYSGAVCSPPYADAGMPSAIRSSLRRLWKQGRQDEAIAGYRRDQARQMAKGQKRGMDTEETIRRRFQQAAERESGNYSAAITSPPYLAALSGGGIARLGHTDDPALARRNYKPETHGLSSGQIGNLHDPIGDIDAVLSSPPYAGVHVGGAGELSLLGQKKAAKIGTKHSGFGGRGQHGFQYSRDADRQIGNATDAPGDLDEALTPLDRSRDAPETYCRSMLRVYSGLHAVLKPGGVVCLVTKNPVRDGKLRRLDEDTIRLMETAGFELIERIQAMLREESTPQLRLDGGEDQRVTERKSFFKRLYEKSHPDLRVDHEDVMFFRRSDLLPAKGPVSSEDGKLQ